MSSQDKNFTEKELKTAIQREIIEGMSFYYSVGKKDQKSFSIMSNERLFVFNFDEGCIFYNNQTRGLPFRGKIPSAKNQMKILISNATIINAPEQKIIEFSFQFANQYQSWKFEFETLQLTKQWLKLFDLHKQSQMVQSKDIKAINKSIIEISKIEQQNNKDIVKEEKRDIPVEESRILNQLMGLSKSRISQPPESRVRQNRSNTTKSTADDWNLRFYQDRHIRTLYEYENFAADTFFELLNKDDFRKGGIRYYETKSCTIKIANKFTPQAKKLKNQYRNYHCIIEATNKKWIIGVPLACLIEFECVVGLVKARFPQQIRPLSFQSIGKEHFNELDRYTRIKNKVLENALVFNLAEYYEPNIRSLLFVDDLFLYLPPNLQFPTEQTLIRPEYMLDHINYYIYNNYPQKLSKNDIRALKELSYSTLDKIKTFNNIFSRQSFPIVRISQLKDLIHESGLNFKSLPLIYNQCQNPQIRKYIYTAMTAKIVKDYAFQSMVQIKKTTNNGLQIVVQETLSWLLSGNNNKSHQFWKQIALIFKKKYNITLVHKDLIPGFFLNSILELIPGSYDITKLNKAKGIFQSPKMIEPGFVKLIQPKIKCFNRFLPLRLQQLKEEAKFNKHSRQMCEQIKREFFGDSNKQGSNAYFQFGNNDQWIIEYLSLYYPPQNMADQKQDRIAGLFSRINEEPPSNFTMTLTKNYLQWCNKKQKTQQFKKVFKVAMEIADYWLDETHPVRSDLLQILSDYYKILGLNEDMIRFMKDSLVLCSKFWGPNAEHTGLKQYELADRYLKDNRKKEALDYFLRAKDNIQHNKTKTNKLGLTHLKLSSIYLSNLQYQKATSHAKQSMTVFDDYQRKIKSYGIYNQPYKIKAYELLSRIFQICDQRTQYKDLAMTCARKFNQTKKQDVYEQMIRICLASVIFKSTTERAESFEILINRLDQIYNENNQQLSPFDQLRRMGEQMIVMEKFMTKYEFIDRKFFDSNSRKKLYLLQDNKDFIHILRNIVEIVGEQYIKGLIEQKISCG